MKKIYLLAVCLLAVGFAQGQETDTTKTEKSKSKEIVLGANGDGVKITINSNEDDSVKKAKKQVKYPKMVFDLTFDRFDIGLSKYHSGSDFSTPAGYPFLETQAGKTLNVGFDFAQMGIRFNPHVKVMLAAGLDWNHMRLRQNVTILPNQPVLTASTDAVDYEKNRFSSRYLRVPLYFEYKTAKNEKGKKATVIFGPEVGFLLNGKVKQVSGANGKTKVKDDYNFEPLRYGANMRIGYGGAGIFFKYYMNDVFANNQGPADFKNLNFGFTFGF